MPILKAHRQEPPTIIRNGDTIASLRKQKRMADRYIEYIASVRSLNDELRTRLRGGEVIICDNVQELGSTVVAHALVAMSESKKFDDREHRSGRFVFCARTFRWWISYGDSRNPTNRFKTKRELFLSL